MDTEAEDCLENVKNLKHLLQRLSYNYIKTFISIKYPGQQWVPKKQLLHIAELGGVKTVLCRKLSKLSEPQLARVALS